MSFIKVKQVKKIFKVSINFNKKLGALKSTFDRKYKFSISISRKNAVSCIRNKTNPKMIDERLLKTILKSILILIFEILQKLCDLKLEIDIPTLISLIMSFTS